MLEESPNAYKRIASYLSHKDTKDENYKWALEFAHDRAYGKAQNFLDVDVKGVTKYDPDIVDRAIESETARVDQSQGMAKRKREA